MNYFTFGEWSVETPASLADMSIGEEQSTSTVTSIAWSSPGLGTYRRSVLAVLTTNLLLALWDPGPNLVETSSWRRVTIMNDHLEAYLELTTAPRKDTRKSRRVRAMCWADSILKDDNTERIERHILAVVNDSKELIVFLVSRSPLYTKGNWTILGLGRSNVTVITDTNSCRQCSYEITFSSWVHHQDAVEALISCHIGISQETFKFGMRKLQVRILIRV